MSEIHNPPISAPSKRPLTFHYPIPAQVATEVYHEALKDMGSVTFDVFAQEVDYHTSPRVKQLVDHLVHRAIAHGYARGCRDEAEAWRSQP